MVVTCNWARRRAISKRVLRGGATTQNAPPSEVGGGALTCGPAGPPTTVPLTHIGNRVAADTAPKALADLGVDVLDRTDSEGAYHVGALCNQGCGRREIGGVRVVPGVSATIEDCVGNTCPCGGTYVYPSALYDVSTEGHVRITPRDDRDAAMLELLGSWTPRDVATPTLETIQILRQLVSQIAKLKGPELRALQQQIVGLDDVAPEDLPQAMGDRPGLVALLRPGTHAELMDQIKLISRILAILVVIGLGATASGQDLVGSVVKQLVSQTGAASP